jgi:signal transduction histidine kinase
MNIKTRLSIQFTLIAAGILLFFSLLVYYFSYTSQLKKFRENLLDSARNTAILLINVAEVDSSLLKKIHQSTISRENEEIALTDSISNIIYSNNLNYLTENTLYLYSNDYKTNFFSIGNKDGVCYKHIYNSRKYFVYVLAFDAGRSENMTELREILLWSILFSICLSVLLSYLFSKRAIKPITKIIKSVKEINSLRLSNRLNEGKRKDEIDQLAITFNEMLANLEIAFKNQEDFVLNASHELRTPLTVMIGESDYILLHERASVEYKKHISGLIADLKKLNTLLNSLLELAQVNRDTRIPLSDVRIDEIIFNSIHQVKSNYQGRKIIPKIRYPEQGNDLLIMGNEGLLTIVFKNLIDNACKFSADDVIIDFMITGTHVTTIISDKGIGIPADDLADIYKPFKRASNAKFIGGFGIGLALVAEIMELHNAEMSIESRENEGTSIKIKFNRIK